MQHRLKNLFRRSKSVHTSARGYDITSADASAGTSSTSIQSQESSLNRSTAQDNKGMSSTIRRVLSSEEERRARQDEIAGDYQAYLPALSSTTSKSLTDGMNHMSLGGDPRLATDPSTRRYEEDVADRNIARWSGGSVDSWHSSSETKEQFPVRHSLSKSSMDSNDPSIRARRDSLPEHKVHTHYWSKEDRGPNSARDEVGLNKPRDRSDSSPKPDHSGSPHVQHRTNTTRHPGWNASRKQTNVRASFVDGNDDSHSMPYRQKRDSRGPSLEGVVDLEDSVDVDKTTRIAPAVVHEVVKPHEHEIIEERIYREIHNYDYYHYVLPVREVEVLPARHFVSTPNGNGLTEVSGTNFPGWAERNPAWAPRKVEDDASRTSQMPAKLSEPKIIDDKKYMTPEGYERRETTWLHPASLEDLSGYSGPVMPIHFVHGQVADVTPNHDDILSTIPSNGSGKEQPIPSNLVPPRKASLRKPVGTTSTARKHDSVTS